MTENRAIDILNVHLCFLKDEYIRCNDDFIEAIEKAIMSMKENKQYREIGTFEELKKYIVKKRPLVAFDHQKKAGYRHRCPNCNCAVGYVEKKPFRTRVLVEHAAPYCCICGQAIDWGNYNE